MNTERKNYVITGSDSERYIIHEKNHIAAFIACDIQRLEVATFLKDHANSGMPALTEREWRAIVAALVDVVVKRTSELHGIDLAQLAENIENSIDEAYPKDLETLTTNESTESVETAAVKEQTAPTYFGALEVGDEFYDLKETRFVKISSVTSIEKKVFNCVCIGNGDLKGRTAAAQENEYVLKIIT